MTISLQSWMRIVWVSLTQPAEMAGKVKAMQFSGDALWTSLALAAVLNVLLVGALQLLSPEMAEASEQVITVSPFSFLTIVGAFLTLMVFMLVHAGRMMGGDGTIEATLTLVIWFQAVRLTLVALQFLIFLISPNLGLLFAFFSIGALIWLFVNLVNVLHGFENLGKALVVGFMAIIGTGLGTLVLMGMLGVTPPEGAI